MDNEKLACDLALLFAKTRLERNIDNKAISDSAKSIGCCEWELEIKQLKDDFIHAYNMLKD